LNNDENFEHKKLEIYSVIKDYFSNFETETIFLSYNKIMKEMEEQYIKRQKINRISNIIDEIIIRASNGESIKDNQELKQEYVNKQLDVNGCIGHKWIRIYKDEFESFWKSYQNENPY
jgi:hypothetical protein